MHHHAASIEFANGPLLSRLPSEPYEKERKGLVYAAVGNGFANSVNTQKDPIV